MTWYARLDLSYSEHAGRCTLKFAHQGPLRILQSLYPEGPGICHNVLVHPPGGLVGGDEINIALQVGEGAHALLTTPGATRFYKTSGPPASQRLHATLAQGARLEWLPLENIAYSGCEALSSAQFDLAPGAQLLAWDITALGLPAAQQPFERGSFTQHLQVGDVWLDRGRMAAQDQRLLQSPLGLAGHTCLATLVFASGSPWPISQRDELLDAARAHCTAHSLARTSGVTCAHPQVLVLRALAHHTEDAANLCRQVWATWRATAWGLSQTPPRIWAM
jgi:urease accessory protein